jgi:hypothetical protein
MGLGRVVRRVLAWADAFWSGFWSNMSPGDAVFLIALGLVAMFVVMYTGAYTLSAAGGPLPWPFTGVP